MHQLHTAAGLPRVAWQPLLLRSQHLAALAASDEQPKSWRHGCLLRSISREKERQHRQLLMSAGGCTRITLLDHA